MVVNKGIFLQNEVVLSSSDSCELNHNLEHKINIDFYSVITLNKVQLLIKLLAKTLDSHKKALVLISNQEELIKVNDALWTSYSWLPHALETDKFQEQQLVLLVSNLTNNHNASEYLFIINNENIDWQSVITLQSLKRIVIILEQTNLENMEYGKNLWQELKNKLNYFSIQYLQQNKQGKFDSATF